MALINETLKLRLCSINLFDDSGYSSYSKWFSSWGFRKIQCTIIERLENSFIIREEIIVANIRN